MCSNTVGPFTSASINYFASHFVYSIIIISVAVATKKKSERQNVDLLMPCFVYKITKKEKNDKIAPCSLLYLYKGRHVT